MLTSTALAEHYAISKTPLARGLKVINTERASVTMRYDTFVNPMQDEDADGIKRENLCWRRYSECDIQNTGRRSLIE